MMKQSLMIRTSRFLHWTVAGIVLVAGCRQETPEPLLNRDLGAGSDQILLPTRPLRTDSTIMASASVQLIQLTDPQQEEEDAVDTSIKTPQELIETFTEMMQEQKLGEILGFLVSEEKFHFAQKILTQTMILIAQNSFQKLEKLLKDKFPDEFANLDLLAKLFTSVKLEPASDGSMAVDVTWPKPNGGTMTFRIPLVKAVSGMIFDPDLEGGPERMQAFVRGIKAYRSLLESDTLDGKGAKEHLKALYVQGVSVVFPDAVEKADFTLDVKEKTSEASATPDAQPASPEGKGT